MLFAMLKILNRPLKLILKLRRVFKHWSLLFKHRKFEDKLRQLSTRTCRSSNEHTKWSMAHKIAHTCRQASPSLWRCLYSSPVQDRWRFQLLLPHTRTTRYRESFFYRSALLWNSLPHDIQSLKNSKSFRDALENHYQTYKFTTTENFHIPLSSAFS